ncbi:hypothetical protein Shyd_48220 [Streptomyces hydrogenans]|uniref:Tetrapyrrole methylase domain-containing protein n=2 Tax=Streptomyces hydrogenans TaxID=1873719 RepID=A0ABQ3PEK1_9ACTN|nr:hypothetical protein Shyd_48220 [Streptomyces hydrogenans]
MPSVSDPGYRLVAAAVEADIKVTAVPGPSAVLTALALSRAARSTGSASRGSCRGRRASDWAGSGRSRRAAHPRLYFEARTGSTTPSTRWAEVFGTDRRAAVCRELTKTYEEVKRGPLGELAAWAKEGVRGEITVVVEGRPGDRPGGADAAELGLRRVRVRGRGGSGERRKEAIAAVAARRGCPSARSSMRSWRQRNAS